jgi:hypothetical protein
VIDEEQVWIAKYRLTLSATPVKASRLEAFSAKLRGMIQEVLSGIVKAFHKKKANSLPKVKRFEESSPGMAQATVSESNPQNRSNGSIARAPGKLRPLGQPRRRRAS